MTKIALVSALAAVGLGSAPASADVLSMRAEIVSGGSTGAGVGGAQKDNAFHAGTEGFAYGAIVGVEVMFLDVWVQHNQHHDADGLAGTWTQFMTGVDLNWDIGAPTKGAQSVSDGKPSGGYAAAYGEFGLGIGAGFGTGQQIELPLDRSELSDRAFLFQVHAGVGYRLTRGLSLGLQVPVQAGYALKEGVANDLDNHYQSVQAAALLNLRLDVVLK